MGEAVLGFVNAAADPPEADKSRPTSISCFSLGSGFKPGGIGQPSLERLAQSWG